MTKRKKVQEFLESTRLTAITPYPPPPSNNSHDDGGGMENGNAKYA